MSWGSLDIADLFILDRNIPFHLNNMKKREKNKLAYVAIEECQVSKYMHFHQHASVSLSIKKVVYMLAINYMSYSEC